MPAKFPNIKPFISHLSSKKKVLFLTTSNRWSGEEGGELPKSTQFAYELAKKIGKHVKVIEVPQLTIYPCEGNVSTARGNTCGLKAAILKSKVKNPSGHHRCFASLNNKDDELWKISKALFASDAVVFFGSVRWGQMNGYYQKLIERLTWIENRHSSLGEKNIVANIDAGIVIFGHNWKGKEVLKTQKDVLKFFGFQVKKQLCMQYQFLRNANNETNAAYKEDAKFVQKKISLGE